MHFELRVSGPGLRAGGQVQQVRCSYACSAQVICAAHAVAGARHPSPTPTHPSSPCITSQGPVHRRLRRSHAQDVQPPRLCHGQLPAGSVPGLELPNQPQGRVHLKLLPQVLQVRAAVGRWGCICLMSPFSAIPLNPHPAQVHITHAHTVGTSLAKHVSCPPFSNPAEPYLQTLLSALQV